MHARIFILTTTVFVLACTTSIDDSSIWRSLSVSTSESGDDEIVLRAFSLGDFTVDQDRCPVLPDDTVLFVGDHVVELTGTNLGGRGVSLEGAENFCFSPGWATNSPRPGGVDEVIATRDEIGDVTKVGFAQDRLRRPRRWTKARWTSGN